MTTTISKHAACFLVITTTFLLPACSKRMAPQKGLVGEYLLQGDANDNTSYRNHGKAEGAAQLVTGHTGKRKSAYHFDGSDQYITIPHAAQTNFEAGEDFSVSLWVSPDTKQTDLGAGLNDILRKWRGDTQGYPFCIVYYNSDAHDSIRYKVSFVRYDGSICRNAPQLFSATPLPGGAFTHIVCLREGNTVRMYVNGKLVAAALDPTKPAAVCGSHNNAPITIGTRGNKVRFFTGAVDDVRFYNRALTEKEIQQLYKL